MMYNKGWVIRKLDITNHRSSLWNFIVCVDKCTPARSTVIHNFQHNYYNTNDDTILLITTRKINRKVIHATLLFAFISVLQLGVQPYFVWLNTQMMYNKGWVIGKKHI